MIRGSHSSNIPRTQCSWAKLGPSLASLKLYTALEFVLIYNINLYPYDIQIQELQNNLSVVIGWFLWVRTVVTIGWYKNETGAD